MESLSYRNSHIAGDKGILYDKHYHEEFWPGFIWEREKIILSFILQHYFMGKEIKLLDFACGTGRILEFLEDKVSSSIGIDISESMLNEAQKKLKSTRLIKADLSADQKILSEKFNLITVFRFFLNAEESLRRDVLKSLAHLLSTDGYLVINNHRNTKSIITFAISLYKKIKKKPAMRTMSVDELKPLLAEHGIEIVEVYPAGFFNLIRYNIPGNLLHLIENSLSKIRFLRFYSEDQVIVCRLKQK